MLILFFLSALFGLLGAEDGAPGTARLLRALHCPPCEQVHCSSRRALKLQCKGGVTTCVCGCCPVCARVEGETCGGAWDYLGKCDKGLVCAHQDSGKPESEQKGTCKTGKRRFTKCTCILLPYRGIKMSYRETTFKWCPCGSYSCCPAGGGVLTHSHVVYGKLKNYISAFPADVFGAIKPLPNFCFHAIKASAMCHYYALNKAPFREKLDLHLFYC